MRDWAVVSFIFLFNFYLLLRLEIPIHSSYWLKLSVWLHLVCVWFCFDRWFDYFSLKHSPPRTNSWISALFLLWILVLYLGSFALVSFLSPALPNTPCALSFSWLLFCFLKYPLGHLVLICKRVRGFFNNIWRLVNLLCNGFIMWDLILSRRMYDSTFRLINVSF